MTSTVTFCLCGLTVKTHKLSSSKRGEGKTINGACLCLLVIGVWKLISVQKFKIVLSANLYIFNKKLLETTGNLYNLEKILKLHIGNLWLRTFKMHANFLSQSMMKPMAVMAMFLSKFLPDSLMIPKGPWRQQNGFTKWLIAPMYT